MEKQPKVVGRIWMNGRRILMGQCIKEYYFDSIFDYMSKAVVNVVPPDQEIYSIDITEPSEEMLREDPSAAEAFKEMKEYESKMSKALVLSAEMGEDHDFSIKNSTMPGKFDRFITHLNMVTDNCVEVQIDIDVLNDETIETLKKFCSKAKKKGFEVKLVAYRGMLEKINGGRVVYCFNQTELELLSKVNNICQKTFGRELLFQAGPAFIDLRQWKYSEVLSANNKLYKVAKDIFDLNLSPAEAQLVIHKYASSFFYRPEKEYVENSRTILAVLSDQNSPHIVCGAYASIEKAITDKLIEMGFKGLENELCTYKTREPGDKLPSFHCYNLVSICDKKYNLRGKYVDDATKDAPTEEFPFQQALNFYMVPISDLAKLKEFDIKEDYARYMVEVANYIVFSGALKTDQKHRMALIKKYSDLNAFNETSRVFASSNQGVPIDYETLKKITYNTFSKLLPEVPEDRRKIMINYELAMSVFFARTIFKKNAQNGFVKHANSLTREQMKDVKNFVFPSKEQFKNLQDKMMGK